MDLAKIIQDIVGEIESKYPEASIKMKRSLLRSPMMVLADELLEDLLYSIVEDAVRHQGDEEVVLQMMFEQVPDSDRKSIRLSIADHNLKVKAGESFSVFYSVVPREGENGNPRRSLQLAMTLVERYEGRVWTEDRVQGDWDKGSNVVVEFPHA
jgi:K+-sensing histidine kinase KdpD